MSVPRDPSEHPVDWTRVRTSVRRRLAFHLRGWPEAEIEDATQDVLVKLFVFLERSGPAENLEGLLTVIAKRTAVERIRARSRRPAHEPVRDDSAEASDDELRRELARLQDEVQWRALQVMAFFRDTHAPCLELAEARANGIDFKQLAATTNQSHSALLQRWSRCMRRLREALSRGRLRWDPPGEGA